MTQRLTLHDVTSQDMDGVARPVHKEVHVRKPVTYEV